MKLFKNINIYLCIGIIGLIVAAILFAFNPSLLLFITYIIGGALGAGSVMLYEKIKTLDKIKWIK